MATKSPGTPRKTTSRKTTAKQSNTVTPIRESVSENGASQVPPELHEEIRIRAYALYLERGRQHGFDQEDWSRAEREILSKYQREKTA